MRLYRELQPLGRMLPCSGRALASLLVIASFAAADEVIYFKNGFSLAAVSHVDRGEMFEIQVGSGTLLFSSDQVSKVETVPGVQFTGQASRSESAGTVVRALQVISPEKILYEAAVAQGVDAVFVRSVAIVESGLKQASLSSKGAIGLMQLMPATAKDLGVDATISDQNARGGVQYLRSLLLKYRGDSALALAAYNAGPGAVQKYKGVPPYRETRQYVLSVLKEYNRQLRLQKADAAKLATIKKPNKPSATD